MTIWIVCLFQYQLDVSAASNGTHQVTVIVIGHLKN